MAPANMPMTSLVQKIENLAALGWRSVGSEPAGLHCGVFRGHFQGKLTNSFHLMC